MIVKVLGLPRVSLQPSDRKREYCNRFTDMQLLS